MAGTSNSGITDGVDVAINAEPPPPDPDSKGPDPDVWQDPERRDEAKFVPTPPGTVKGPDPAVWGEEHAAAITE